MYTPENPPRDIKDTANFLDWVKRELDRVSQEFETGVERIRLTKLSVAPRRFRDGTIVYADGVNWDPTGEGEGFYGYYSSSWHKLG